MHHVWYFCVATISNYAFAKISLKIYCIVINLSAIYIHVYIYHKLRVSIITYFQILVKHVVSSLETCCFILTFLLVSLSVQF